MYNSTKTRLLFFGTLLVGFLSSPSFADIDEIIVTAMKREQRLQDAPVSVAVVDSETVKRTAALDILDISYSIPSFKTTQQQQSGATNLWIRGFANGANNIGLVPSVAYYVDGVARMRAFSVLSDLPDLERVEILRGPQSTLFGKNASAGVVGITTVSPSSEQGGSLEVTLGNMGASVVKGMITGPLSETTSYRLAASVNQRDGFVENLVSGSMLNEKNRWALRGQLLAQPSEDLSIRVILDKDELDELCCGTSYFSKGQLTRGIIDPMSLARSGVAPPTQPGIYDLDYRVAFNVEPTNVIENQGVSVQVDYDYEDATLTSVTGLRSGSMDARQDADQSGVDILKEQQLNFDYDQFTHETRLTSTGDGKARWTAGVFYAKETYDSFRTVLYGPDMAPFLSTFLSLQNPPATLGQIATIAVTSQVPGFNDAVAAAVPALMAPPMSLSVGDATSAATAQVAGQYAATVPNIGTAIANFQNSLGSDGGGDLGENFHQTSETASIFANLELDLSEQLVASVGFNYTENTTEGSGAAPTDDNWSDLPSALNGGNAFFPSYTSWPNSTQSGVVDSSDLTHTVKLMYSMTDDTMLYVSHSTGFKPKVINMLFSLGGYNQADGEESTALEIGFKSAFENGFVNLTWFSQELEGLQDNVFTGTGFRLANAGSATHEGAELELAFALSESLLLGLSATYMDPIYDDYTAAPCVSPTSYGLADPSIQASLLPYLCINSVRDMTGQTPSGIPEIAANLNLTYSLDNMYARIEYYHESEYGVFGGLPGEVVGRKHDDINASFGKTFANGFDVRIWGRNLTNNQTVLTAFPVPLNFGTWAGYFSTPRTYGLTVSKNF